MSDLQTTTRGAGSAFVWSAAASAAVLLFLPVMMVGYTMSVAASVLRGEGLAWVSSVAMSFAFGGVLALLSLFLLLIPWALFRAARRRFGTRRATRWVGGLLVVWHAGTAAFWASSATSPFTRAAVGEGLWYPAAFAVAAVAILIATVLVGRQAIGVAIAFAGLLAIAFAALLAIVVVGWGSGPTVPPGAQVVHIVLAGGDVNLETSTVHAGDVYFLVQGPATRSGRP